MKPLKLFSLLMAIFLPVCSLFADPGSINRPYFVKSTKLIDLLHDNPGVINEDLPVSGAAKVCACQILRVSSNNEKMEYVAVFSEKTNNGVSNNSFSVAMSVLEKEKRQMKNHFYPKMKVVERYTAFSNCRTLAGRLRSDNGNLKIYDILDADILGSVYLSPKR